MYEDREKSNSPKKKNSSQSKDHVKKHVAQRQLNKTGLPDNLKSGIENLSGYSMDDVKVHYNSDKPAQLNAHAYAQGTDIHVASGQEKHLPHEAWHVVQQKQGRVKPTMQMKDKNSIEMNQNSSQNSIRQFVRKVDLPESDLAKSSGLFSFLRKMDGLEGITMRQVNDWKAGRVCPLLDNITDEKWHEYEIAFNMKKKEQEENLGAVKDKLEKEVVVAPPVAKAPQAIEVFNFIRKKIGEPLNNGHFADKGEKTFDQLSEIHSAGMLYENVKVDMGINDVDSRNENPEVRLEWMLKTAALGSALGAGVCNSVAALTALILRIMGAQGVKFMSNALHNWAEYSDYEKQSTVDPWKYKTHEPAVVNPKDYVVVDLSHYEEFDLFSRFLDCELIAIQKRDLRIGHERETAEVEKKENLYSGYLNGPYSKRNGHLFHIDE